MRTNTSHLSKSSHFLFSLYQLNFKGHFDQFKFAQKSQTWDYLSLLELDRRYFPAKNVPI